MKKVTAFITALVLVGLTVFGLHILAGKGLNFKNPKFDYWTAAEKYQAPAVIRSNMDKDTLLVLASSELEHGKNTAYHPQQVFAGNQFKTMLIGAGHYQSLYHAITVAALEPGMEKRKVALLVSPQWFRKGGIEPGAFASRFSESSFLDMMENPKLSDETKQEITDRAINLLSTDKATQKRMESYKNLVLEKKGNPLTSLSYKINQTFLNEKQKQGILTQAYLSGIKHQKSEKSVEKEPDWENLKTEAVEDAKKATSNNPFQISNRYFNKKIKSQLEKRKGSSKNSSYSVSPEYEDLRCFLKVCKELDIEPMLVLLPVNGKWYDYTQFPKDNLSQFYKNVHEIAGEYEGVQVVDFSEDSNTDYFMEDTIHIGWKGWVSIDEVLYKFGSES